MKSKSHTKGIVRANKDRLSSLILPLVATDMALDRTILKMPGSRTQDRWL